MRRIEEEMVKAINEMSIGERRKEWRKDNTRVSLSYSLSGKPIIEVYLHGNLIALFLNDRILIRHAGWKTPTTKSRLNVIVRNYSNKYSQIYQKNFIWYLKEKGSDNSIDFSEGGEEI